MDEIASTLSSLSGEVNGILRSCESVIVIMAVIVALLALLFAVRTHREAHDAAAAATRLALRIDEQISSLSIKIQDIASANETERAKISKDLLSVREVITRLDTEVSALRLEQEHRTSQFLPVPVQLSAANEGSVFKRSLRLISRKLVRT
jgi:hypothetical protein